MVHSADDILVSDDRVVHGRWNFRRAVRHAGTSAHTELGRANLRAHSAVELAISGASTSRTAHESMWAVRCCVARVTCDLNVVATASQSVPRYGSQRKLAGRGAAGAIRVIGDIRNAREVFIEFETWFLLETTEVGSTDSRINNLVAEIGQKTVLIAINCGVANSWSECIGSSEIGSG
jgi:hypothetical protein